MIQLRRAVTGAAVGRASRGGAALLALCLVWQSASAEKEREPLWIPSIELGYETYRYDTTATVTNHINPPLQQGTLGNDTQVPIFQLGAELQGPRMGVLPGRPRLFIQGGAGYTTFSSDEIFRLGTPGTPEIAIAQFKTQLDQRLDQGCDAQVPMTCPVKDPGDFDGEGSRITSSILNPSWYAGLGLAFDAPLTDNLLLQIKPSFTYSGENRKISGELMTVTEPIAQAFEVTRSAATTGITDHNLGVGLELALDLFRKVRPITSAIYVDLRCMWLISDPTTTFADDAGVASYEVTRDTFAVRGGAGLRFSWKGLRGD
jgi:hypothetical protein